MAEYIDREDIIPHAIDDDYEEGGERLIVNYKDIMEIPTADVVERADYNKLETINQELWAENEDLERKLEKIEQIANGVKIDKTITKELAFDKIIGILKED